MDRTEEVRYHGIAAVKVQNSLFWGILYSRWSDIRFEALFFALSRIFLCNSLACKNMQQT